MKKLTQKQMKETYGGAINLGLLAGIGAAIVFFVGLFDGYVNPIKCRN